METQSCFHNTFSVTLASVSNTICFRLLITAVFKAVISTDGEHPG